MKKLTFNDLLVEHDYAFSFTFKKYFPANFSGDVIPFFNVFKIHDFSFL